MELLILRQRIPAVLWITYTITIPSYASLQYKLTEQHVSAYLSLNMMLN